jgi:hypothetical protein
MLEVTIKGSIMPCIELPRGEVRRVQHSDHVQRLIERGHVEVVQWHGDEPEPEQEAHGGEDGADSGEPDEADDVAASGTDEGGAVDEEDQTSESPGLYPGLSGAPDHVEGDQ